MRNLILLVVLVGFSFSSCKKYEEGPALSFRSKKARVVNKWIVEKATDLYDNIDITGEYTNLNLEFADNGDYLENDSKLGTWDLDKDKEYIVVIQNPDTFKYRIIKLKEKSLIVETQSNELWQLAPQ